MARIRRWGIGVLLTLVGMFLLTWGIVQAAMKVVFIPPEKEMEVSTQVGQYGELNLTFSDAVVNLSDFDTMVKDLEKKIKITISPKLKGHLRPIDDRNAAFVFDERPQFSTRYTVSVNASEITSLSGSRVNTKINYTDLKDNTYILQTTRFRLESVYGSEELKPTITAYFNQEVSRQSLQQALKISSWGKEHSFTLQPSIYTNTVRETIDTVYKTVITNEKTWYIRPQGLEPAMPYNLVFSADMMGKEGNLGLEKNYSKNFRTYYPLKFIAFRSSTYDKRYYPDSSIRMEFNNEISETKSKFRLSSEPAIPNLKYSISGRHVYINGDFIGGQRYKITAESDIVDIYGQTLKDSISINVSFDHLLSYFEVPTGYMVMESYMENILPVKIRNVSRFTFTHLYFSDLQEMVSFLAKDYSVRDKLLDNSRQDKSIDVDWKWDRFYNFRYDLSTLLNKKSGLLVYKIDPMRENPGQYDTYPSRGMILQTDLGVSVKASPYQVLVYVRQLKTNQPVKDAKVYTVVDGILNLKGTTDNRGILQYDNDSDLYPFIAVDYQGSFGLNYSASTIRWGSEYSYNETRIQLFTERYLYKAGEKVELKGIVRYRAEDQWIINDSRNENKYQFTVKNSRDEEVTNFQAYFDSWGGTHATISLPPDAPNGYYYVTAYYKNDYISSVNFRVEDYKPAKAEMRIIAHDSSYLWGDTFSGDLIGWYLFGAPVIRPITYKINVDPAYFHSKKYSKFSFGVDRWNNEERRDYSFTLDTGTVMPDKQGKLTVKALLEKADFKGDATITFSGSTVLDDKSTVYGARSGIDIFNPVQVGIFMENYFVDSGKPFNAELIAITPKDELYSGQKVKVEVERQEWKSVQKAGVNGRLSWEWFLDKKIVDTRDLSLGRETVTFTVKDPGYYVLRVRTMVRGQEAVSENGFYVIGSGEFGWKMDDSYYLELESDKQEYQVGDQARILVKNPYKTATAVVTYEREKFHEVKRFEVKDSIFIVPVDVTEEFIPNMYVSVMLYSGRTGKNQLDEWGEDIARPSFRSGYINLSVVPRQKKLAIAITSDKAKYEPGQKAQVTVDLKDYQGRPVEGEVVLAVVDKGVLNLVNYRMPDPLTYFYANRSLAVTTREMTELIYGQRYLAEKGEVIGGDGEEDSRNEGGKDGMLVPRSNFKTTAFYEARLKISKGQKGKVSFTIPDNLTSFVIMAVAYTKSSQFGAGDQEFAVSKPLMLLPTLPQFIRIMDEMEAGGMVYNYSGKDQDIKVTLEAENPIEFKGQASQTIKVPNNGSAEIKFRFKLPNTVKKELKFTLTAKAGSFSDGLVQIVPVKMPKTYETTALYKTTTGTINEKIKLGENIWKEMSRVELSLSPSAFTELKGSVDYLIEYPYGCLEQRASQILPLLLGESVIVKQGLLDFKTSKELRELVQSVLDLFPKYYGSQGFTYYPSGYGPNPYLTVYASFILSVAREKGYAVNQSTLDKALTLVKDIARGKGDFRSKWDYSSYYSLLTRAYALYVSSLNGYQDVPVLKRLQLELKEKQPDNLTAWAYLLKTLSRYKSFPGDKEIRAQLEKAILDRARVEAQTLYFEGYNNWGWFYYDSVITTAVSLQALLEAGSEFNDSYKVIRWLIRARETSHWNTTHDNAMVFYAMSTYLDKFEKEDPKFLATVKVDGYTLIRQMFEKRTDPVFNKGFRIKEDVKDDLDFEITRAGQGTLYYLIQYQYLLKSYPPRRDAGFSLEKKVYDYNSGKEVKDNIFKRGQRYIVKIKIFTPKDRTFAVVNDALPSGFEPVNLDFATEENENNVDTGTSSDWWWGSFYHTEQYKDKVLFMSDYLRRGNHELTYVVRAVNNGIFQVPQLKAEEMYAPEVFGYLYQPDVRIED